jgi:hypothetical protein
MWTPIAILIGSSLVAMSIVFLAVCLWKIGDHFAGVANMFFAVSTMQLRIELDELGYECPEWLKIMDDDEQPLDMPQPTELRLVKITKDKNEE